MPKSRLTDIIINRKLDAYQRLEYLNFQNREVGSILGTHNTLGIRLRGLLAGIEATTIDDYVDAIIEIGKELELSRDEVADVLDRSMRTLASLGNQHIKQAYYEATGDLWAENIDLVAQWNEDMNEYAHYLSDKIWSPYRIASLQSKLYDWIQQEPYGFPSPFDLAQRLYYFWGNDQPQYFIDRVVNTELQRAYSYAQLATADEIEDETGVEVYFEVTLSPYHPKPDICDALVGIYKKEDALLPPYHPNCHVGAYSVRIKTDKGIKKIGEIEVGDRVLTHMGRYRKVRRILHNKTYKGRVIRIAYKNSNIKDSRSCFRVTPEHPFLTQRGWVQAGDLLLSDSFYVVANRCKVCNEPIPYWKEYCGGRCVAKQRKVKDKISKKNSGKGNGMYGRREKKSPHWKGGVKWWEHIAFVELKNKVKKRDGYICQNCEMSEGESAKKFKEPLHVHHVNPYRVCKEHKIDNLITLCKSCHKRLEGTNCKEILESGGVEFILSPVYAIEEYENKRSQRLYNFAVEEDESYIANGIVNHNCLCDRTKIIRKPGEKAPGDLMTPGKVKKALNKAVDTGLTTNSALDRFWPSGNMKLAGQIRGDFLRALKGERGSVKIPDKKPGQVARETQRKTLGPRRLLPDFEDAVNVGNKLKALKILEQWKKMGASEYVKTHQKIIDWAFKKKET